MRRGLTLRFLALLSDSRLQGRNEFPDEKGIDTGISSEAFLRGPRRRNEFPDEKGIDTWNNTDIFDHCLISRNEFPDEKGIDTSSGHTVSSIKTCRNEFPDEKGIDTH